VGALEAVDAEDAVDAWEAWEAGYGWEDGGVNVTALTTSDP
jgi:hypothetical protein